MRGVVLLVGKKGIVCKSQEIEKLSARASQSVSTSDYCTCSKVDRKTCFKAEIKFFM